MDKKPNFSIDIEIEKYLEMDEEELITTTGSALFYSYFPYKSFPQLSYEGIFNLGKEFIYAMWFESYNYFCNSSSRLPNKRFQNFTSSNTKELVVGIAMYVGNKYNLDLSITIPASIILAKQGIKMLCSYGIGTIPPRSVSKIIKDEKDGWSKYNT